MAFCHCSAGRSAYRFHPPFLIFPLLSTLLKTVVPCLTTFSFVVQITPTPNQRLATFPGSNFPTHYAHRRSTTMARTDLKHSIHPLLSTSK